MYRYMSEGPGREVLPASSLPVGSLYHAFRVESSIGIPGRNYGGAREYIRYILGITQVYTGYADYVAD